MITEDVVLGLGTVIHHPELVNLYGCLVGDHCKIASFVEIQRGVVIGDQVKIEAFAFIPTGVTVQDNVFIGPHVCFTNDKYPKSTNGGGELLRADEWVILPTLIEEGAMIGANSTIICGVTIGAGAIVGAGSVITRNVPPRSKVCGNPARPMW